MSYTEYLRRKAAAAPVIIDTTPKKVDASFYTSQQRMATNRIFYTSSRTGVINNVSDLTGISKKASGNPKANGGPTPDASTFTSYVGGLAIGGEKGAAGPAARLIANSSASGSISACRTIAEPAPYIPGSTSVYSANTVPQTASSLMNAKYCKDTGRIEPHIASELGPPLFVDNMRPAIPASNVCVNRQAAPCKPVIHTHPVIAPHPTFPNRPPPTPMGPQLSTDSGRKVGAALPQPKYVEKHHGNDGNVNPRRVPTKYKPSNAPARLRINDPISGLVRIK